MHTRQALYQLSHTPKALLTGKCTKVDEATLDLQQPVSTCILHGRKLRHRKLGVVHKGTQLANWS